MLKIHHFTSSKDVITNFCQKKLVIQPDSALLCVLRIVAVNFVEGVKPSAEFSTRTKKSPRPIKDGFWMTKMKKAAARPLVYFEKRSSPMTTGVKWVAELIEIAGGTDVIFVSWCGKKSGMAHLRTREVGQLCQPSKVTALMRSNPR